MNKNDQEEVVNKNENHDGGKDWKVLAEIQRRANSGDPTALEELGKFLNDNPEIVHEIGDVSKVNETDWLLIMHKSSPLSRESIKRKLEDYRVELLKGGGSRMEMMLVEVIVASWLEYNAVRSQSIDPETGGFRGLDFLKRQESAQKRLLQSIKQLEQIRQLISSNALLADLRAESKAASKSRAVASEKVSAAG